MTIYASWSKEEVYKIQKKSHKYSLQGGYLWGHSKKQL